MAAAWGKERGWKVTFVIICFGRRKVLKTGFYVFHPRSLLWFEDEQHLSAQALPERALLPRGNGLARATPLPQRHLQPKRAGTQPCWLCALRCWTVLSFCGPVSARRCDVSSPSNVFFLGKALLWTSYCVINKTPPKGDQRFNFPSKKKKEVLILSCFHYSTQMKQPSPNILEDSLERSVLSRLFTATQKSPWV